MFTKSFSIAFVLVVALHANAHCIINPALGVTGTPSRSDVQRPSTSSECGTVNVASTVGSTTPVAAGAGGAFTVTAQNFNSGQDGSREIKTAKVDTAATGKTFTGTATITTNGILAPTDVGTQPIVFSLPAGTTCTGGADKKSCLVSFTTAGGFGNCVLVTQGAADGAPSGNTTASANSTAVAKSTMADAKATASHATSTKTTTSTASSAVPDSADCKGNGKKGKRGQKAYKAAGSRRARAVLAPLESDKPIRRDASWIWAA